MTEIHNTDKCIAVTGRGVISAIGVDRHQTVDALLNGVSGIGKMKYLDSSHTELPVGEVKLSNAEMHNILGIENKEVSRTALLAIIAIKEALAEAGVSLENAKGKRVVLISGTTVAGMDITERHYESMKAAGKADESIEGHTCEASTNVTADYFGLFAEATTFSTACSSGANAIILGSKLLKDDKADIVVAGGTEALSRFHLNGFNSLMILDKERCRPFDESRRGLNLGEGAGYVVLERKSDAENRGAEIKAYVSGYGNACDAFHQTATSENGRGANAAMKEALETAQLKTTDIEYINAHGTGTPDNDRSEGYAIRAVFGNDYPPVSSTKSLTGHTTSASGGIESVICLLALEHGFIPGGLGFKSATEGGIIPTETIPDKKLTHVMCNSFGFGGNDSSIIFSSVARPSKPEVFEYDSEILADITVDDPERLPEVKRFVKPLELRRMGQLMKGCILSAMTALEQAGLERTDAVVAATDWGCWENSEKFMDQMFAQSEQMLQPTHFMQSTHNTPASQIAIRTQCFGYNATYSHGFKSFEDALADGRRLIETGQCKTVLVGWYDEATPLLRELTGKEFSINCRTIILGRKK